MLMGGTHAKFLRAHPTRRMGGQRAGLLFQLMLQRDGTDGRQLALMLAARITLAHFSVSVARSLPNSAGAIGMGTPPRSTIRALILGSASAVPTPLLSLSTISRGVPAGAPRPAKALVS